ASHAASSATPRASRRPSGAALAGITVGTDPGHNGLNHTDPSFLNHIIWNGRESETCDTTGTQTASGYTEARFTFKVARYLRAALLADGARVVMTRENNHGIGPCVDRRAPILDRHARAGVVEYPCPAVHTHAHGGPPGGRRCTGPAPGPRGPNDPA